MERFLSKECGEDLPKNSRNERQTLAGMASTHTDPSLL